MIVKGGCRWDLPMEPKCLEKTKSSEGGRVRGAECWWRPSARTGNQDAAASQPLSLPLPSSWGNRGENAIIPRLDESIPNMMKEGAMHFAVISNVRGVFWGQVRCWGFCAQTLVAETDENAKSCASLSTSLAGFTGGAC